MCPMDRDWYFVRAAAIARKIYLHGKCGLGVGALRKFYGASKHRGPSPNKFVKGAGGLIRHIVRQFVEIGVFEKDPDGGRRISKEGIKDLDGIASRILRGTEYKEKKQAKKEKKEKKIKKQEKEARAKLAQEKKSIKLPLTEAQKAKLQIKRDKKYKKYIQRKQKKSEKSAIELGHKRRAERSYKVVGKMIVARKERKAALSQIKSGRLLAKERHASKVRSQERLKRIKVEDPKMYASILKKHKKKTKKWKAKNPEKFKQYYAALTQKYRDKKKKRLESNPQKKRVNPEIEKGRKVAKKAALQKLKLTNPEKYKKLKQLKRQKLKAKNPEKYQKHIQVYLEMKKKKKQQKK